MDEQDKLHPLYGKGLPSPAQAGAELRGQVQNLKDFGSTVGRMAAGMAAAPGQALAGMRDTASPYLDRRFVEMEAQGRGFMQGVNDFRRGFAGSNVNFPYAEDASALDAQLGRAKAASANADRLLYGSGGNTDDIRGWAARNNPNPKPYQAPQGLPTSSNDTYGQMAQMLAGQSQQRFGGDALQQLQNIRALGGGEAQPQTVQYAPSNQNAELLQQMLSKMEGVSGQGRIQDRQRAMYMDMARSLAGNSTQLDAEGMRGANALGLEGARNRNAIALEGMRGQNQLAAYGMQGQNQLANTLLGEGMRGQNQFAADTRRGALEMGKLGMEQEFRQPLLDAQIGMLGNQGRYYGGLEKRAEFEASPERQMQRYFADIMKATPETNPAQAWAWANMMADPASMQKMIAEFNETKRKSGKADGGVVGYAEGGAVDPIEEAYRRAGIQRPQQFREQEKQQGLQRPAPAPVSQAAPQQAPAPQPSGRGIFGILGGRGKQIDAAAGYAQGGPINVDGQMVLGPGTGKSDSIPAVIDGERPAALSTGEFVMPVEAVRHFGLDKLNKMVAQSRKGLDTGRQQA